MNTLPSFADALCTELDLALSRQGVTMSNGASRSSGLDKARIWADAIAHGLILSEPLLSDAQHIWSITPDKHAQLHLEGRELSTNRPVHRFTVRTAQRVSPIKHHNWLLGQGQLIFGRPGDTSWLRASQQVYDAWQKEVQAGRMEWNTIDPDVVTQWKKTLLGAWKEYLSTEEEALNHAFLDFCLGSRDTYWIHKVARKDQLHSIGISRTGRLGMPQMQRAVTLSGSAELLQTEGDVFLEVPLSSGAAIRGYVQDHKNLQGLTVRLSWFLESGQAQGQRLAMESSDPH
jgi:hypothetical protein